MTFAVRTTDGRTLGIAPIRAATGAVDPRIPIVRHARLADLLDESVAKPRFDGALLRVFATLALVLAVVGMYGVLAFVVRQRAREIGIRMALGEGRALVIGRVLREGFGLALFGGAIGFGGAMAASRLLRAIVWGDVEPVDPLTYAAVFALLTLATLIASWIPAGRAASADPALTLRGD